ncbi:MAG: beta-propeller fold lactonase family protein, partial [Patescibacteria group bacterium]
SAANWRFSTNGAERFTVASSGNIGIGVTTPLEALDVSGTVRNLFQGNSNVSVASNTQAGVEPYGVAVSGRYAYVTEYTSNELKIFDVSVPSSPVRISTLPIGGGPDSISVNGSYAYVVNDSSSTLQVIDISNPASPAIVGAIGTGTSPKSIFVSGGYAYVVNLNSASLQVFDISNPQQPKLKGSVTTDASPIDVKVQGKYAYVASNFVNTFQVVDVSNPALPVVVGTTGDLGSPLNQIAVSGRYAYATIYNNFEVKVIDISNPASPSAASTISFPRPVAIAISGRYLFVTSYALATDRLGIFDIQNASSITQVVDAPIGVYVRGIAVSGKNVYLTNSGDDTMSVLDIDGVETSAILAHSAEVGTLSVLTNASINNQLSVGGGLVVGSGGILSQGSLAISSTNTTSTFVFAVSTTNAEISNRLTVGGVNVCLANGTNCTAAGVPAGAYIWTDSAANNTIYNTTTTRDVLIGGNTTDTANFILDKNGVTSTVIIGSGTGNANLLVGTTTYGGGLNSNFVMNGNDVFVQGMVGSQEGLFSATGVTVGTGSTIYGDGNLYKTTVGDFNLALNTASTSWRFKTAGQERFTVASSGNIGIGVSTPFEALDVSGTIRDVWQNQTMRFTSSTLINATISTFEVKGKYGYFTTQEAAGSLGVADLSNRDYPVVVGTSTVTGGSPSRLALSANTAIVLNQNTYYADILDISNPARPVLVTSTYLNDWVADVAMSGGFAYITTASNGLKVLDMSNPAKPAIIGTLANIKERIIIQGRYLFSAASTDNIFRVVDISNPAVPVQVGTLTLAGDDLGVLAVNGRYVYTLGVNGYSTPIVRIIDISNPASPSVAATINSTGNYADGMVFGGRYLYLNNREVYDVSSSTNPTLVTNLPFNFAAGSVSGKYAYFANNDLWPTGDLVTMDLPGIETSSLLAHTAEVGSLSVLTNASIFNQLTVGGGLSVGPGGILSQGSLAISSTNTTSTIGFAVSTTNAEISNRLTVGGVNVCLYSGTNCPTGWNIWSESSTGNVVYMTNVNRDLLIGGSTSNTAGFIFDKGNGSSNVIIGGATDTNLYVGTTTYGGGLNANYAMSGNDIFAQGMVGSIEGLFSATGVTVGTGSTIYGDGNLYKTTAGDFNLSLNNAASNWRFKIAGAERLTVASSGNVGIGVSTPLEALDVSGTIQNILRVGQSFTTVTSTTVGDAPQGVAVVGHLAYVVNAGTSDNLQIWDVAYPQSPSLVGSVSVGNDPQNIQVAGRYAYIAHSASQDLYVVDVSNPATPYVVGTLNLGANGDADLFLAGSYLYTNKINGFNVVDISNPISPTIVTSVTEAGSTVGSGIYVQGAYLYVNTVDYKMSIYNISNPAQPFLTTSTYTGVDGRRVVVNGSNAYVTGNSGSLAIVNIASSTTPTLDAIYSGLMWGYGLAKAGRYLYVSSGSDGALRIMDVSSSTSPYLISSVSLAGGTSEGVAVAGRYAYVTDAVNDKLSIVDVKGFETNGFNAGSAEIGSLQILNDAAIAGRLYLNGGLFVGAGGIMSQGALNINSTNTTSTINFALQAAVGEFTSRLTVGGSSVCLANGSNCPTGTTLWTESTVNNTLYQTNTGRDVLLGGSSTDTAGFIFDKGTTTSTVIIGSSSGNANLLVGTTTYGGGLNTNFVMDGNDVFVQGMIGSKEGLFSATGVTVGLGSTVYGDGNLYKTTAGDFTLSLNNAASNWRFRSGNQESLTVASTGNIGIGVSTPLEALDVSGTIQNILRVGQTFTVMSTTSTDNEPQGIAVAGHYVYVANNTDNTLQTFDATNPSNPSLVSRLSLSGARSVAVGGKYAYVGTSNSVLVVDISTPGSPYQVSTVAVGNQPSGMALGGRYLYVANEGSNTLSVIDVGDAVNPQVVTTFALGGTVRRVTIQGKYLYLANASLGSLQIVDISNPTAPVIVGTQDVGDFPFDVAVQGRYAYVTNYTSNNVSVVDVSNPVSPTGVATSTGYSGAGGIAISGRYLYVTNYGSNTSTVVDVSVATNPTVIGSIVTGNGPLSLQASGRYLYVANQLADSMSIVDIGGIETNGLNAASAEFGTLQVLNNASVAGQLSVGSDLIVGVGGIYSAGSITVSATNTTSTFIFAVSSTNGEFSNRLTVGGVNVCLANGNNCPGASVTSYIWSESVANNTIYNSTSTRDILLGGSTTATAQFIFDKGTTVSTVIVGGQSDANLLVGNTTYPGGLNANFALSGNDMYVQGMVGSLEGLFSATGVTVGTGSTIYGDGYLYKTTSGDFTLNLNNAASNWRFQTGGTERLTVASSGNIGIGVATPLQALDVNGSIDDTLHAGQTFTTVTTTNLGDNPVNVYMSGKNLYVTQGDYLKILDVSNPAWPSVVSSTYLGPAVSSDKVVVQGRYAYVTLYYSGNTTGKLAIVDISNPAAPSVVGTADTNGYGSQGVFVSGGYAYVANYVSSSVSTIDISNPTAPFNTTTTHLGSGAGSNDIYVQGRYAYVTNFDNWTMSILDLANPAYPTIASTISVGRQPRTVSVQGRYAYITNYGLGQMQVIDVSNPSSPTIVGTASVGTSPRTIVMNGRYAYVTNYGSNSMSIVDVSSSTNPTVMATVSVGTNPRGMDVAGRYAYVANSTDHTVSVIDIKGIETNGLVVASAEVGTLQVLSNGNVSNNFTVGGGLTVGQGGVYSNGPLGVYGTSTLNSAIIGGSLSIGTTSTNIGERLQVDGNVLIRMKSLASAESWSLSGTSLVGAPTARYNAGTVWTGSKMLVFSGVSYEKSGGSYDSVKDIWTTMSTTNMPDGRTAFTSIWTGSKMIVWGGYGSTGVTSTGSIYDPQTDSWKTMSVTNAPSARQAAHYVWTGSKMIVWGGSDSGGSDVNTGAVYDPVTDAWTTMSTTNAPAASNSGAAVWATPTGTSSKMIVWSGYKNATYANSGAMYDPVTDAWTTMSTTNAPSGRTLMGYVWTGSKMIVWGGFTGAYVSTGGVFDPVSNSWSSMTNTNAPSGRDFFANVWTGSKMIVWGGMGSGVRFNDGAIYDPCNDSWTTMTSANAPSNRRGMSYVWTGSKMIVWGGQLDVGLGNDGYIYTPADYQGNLMVEGNGYFNGDLQVTGDTHAGGFYSKSGSDFAEYMPVDTASALGTPSAGDVVVLSSGNQIAKSSAATRGL